MVKKQDNLQVPTGSKGGRPPKEGGPRPTEPKTSGSGAGRKRGAKHTKPSENHPDDPDVMEWLKTAVADPCDMWPGNAAHPFGEQGDASDPVREQRAANSLVMSTPARTHPHGAVQQGPARRLRSKTPSGSPSVSTTESEPEPARATASATAGGIVEAPDASSQSGSSCVAGVAKAAVGALLAQSGDAHGGATAGSSSSMEVSTGQADSFPAGAYKDSVRFVQNNWENNLHLYFHGDPSARSSEQLGV